MKDKLIQSVSPVPVPAQLYVAGPLAAGFFSLFPAFFAFVISNMLVSVFGSRSMHLDPVFIYGVVVFVLSFGGLMAYLATKCFIEPTKTVYRIFSDRIEYEDGLLNKQKRTLMLDQVIDVTESQGVLQQTVGAGTVVLVTQQFTSSGEGKLSNRSIAIKNIPNSNEVYEILCKLALDASPKK